LFPSFPIAQLLWLSPLLHYKKSLYILRKTQKQDKLPARKFTDLYVKACVFKDLFETFDYGKAKNVV